MGKRMATVVGMVALTGRAGGPALGPPAGFVERVRVRQAVLLNALFHGMDFRKIYSIAPFSFTSFLYVLVVLAGWAYVLGAIYAVVRNWLAPEAS